MNKLQQEEIGGGTATLIPSVEESDTLRDVEAQLDRIPLGAARQRDVFSGTLRYLKALLITLRPTQWYKNAILFAGVVLSLNFTDISQVGLSILAFISFCGLSGSEYTLNDLMDRKRDQVHSVKRLRPIASGELGVSQAAISAVGIATISLVIAYSINLEFFMVALGYLSLMIAYSLKIKYIVVLDNLTIGTGFVLRAVGGCLAIGVWISPWLIICTFLLALFLAFAKRRSELAVLTEGVEYHRPSLKELTKPLVEQLLNITTAALIVSYLLYTFNSDHYFVMLTIPFPIYGLFRYLILMHSKDFGGEPEKLFRDKPIVITLVLWGFCLVAALYAGSVVS